MLRPLATFAFAALVGSSAFGQDAATAEIAALLASYERAVNELDVELAEEIWSQDSAVSFIQPRGHQRGWADIRQNFYLGTMGNLPTRHLTIGDFEIHLLTDDAAWAEFYWTFEATLPDGTPIESAGRETQVFKRENGVWQIQHVHYSGMPTQEEGEGF